MNIYQLQHSETQHCEGLNNLCDEVASIHANDVDSEARFPTETIDALRNEGWLGRFVPESAAGEGQSTRLFVSAVERLAQSCGSSAMIYVMHVAATQAIVASSTLGERDGVLSEITQGKHLSTLAFSEKGSRSQFWAPVSKLTEDGDGYCITASKSWVTSANFANSYVATAQSPAAKSPMDSTLYLLRPSAGAEVVSSFNGLGLRGNDSAPVELRRVGISKDDLLTEPGGGIPMALQVVLPWFAIGTAAMANGLASAALDSTCSHVSQSGFEHNKTSLRDLPTLRSRIARMSVATQQSRSLLSTTATAMESPDETTPLLVLQARLAALETAIEVTDLAMKACGGAAFSKHLGIERYFRDARAGWVMAPTVDHLNDFVGRALLGMELFE